MSYAPSSRSYWDGMEKGTRTERARILALLDKYTYGTDSWDTGVVHNYTDLLAEIEQDTDNED